MSSLSFEERFTLPAPPAEVWRFLVDPERVVTCLPGAELQASSGDGRHHEGSVEVRAGPVTVSYRGEADFVEVDEGAMRMRMEARGRETTGSGSVRMTLRSEVAGRDGGAEVSIHAEVHLTGRLVSFGRGMIDAVARELLDDFTRCLARRLEDRGSAPSGGGTPAGEATPSSAPAFRILLRAALRWLRGLLGRG